MPPLVSQNKNRPPPCPRRECSEAPLPRPTDRPCGRRSLRSPNSHRPVRSMPPLVSQNKNRPPPCPRRECSEAPLPRPTDRPCGRRSLRSPNSHRPVRSMPPLVSQNKNRQKAVFILASPARIELTAPGLGNLCSIRLSYGDVCFFLPVFYLKRNKKTELLSSVFHYPSKCPKKYGSCTRHAGQSCGTS